MICGESDEHRQRWQQRLSSPQRLRVATACFGSDVCVLTVEMSLHELKDALHLTGLTVDHVWSCESEPFKRDFLESVMGVKAIYLWHPEPWAPFSIQCCHVQGRADP